MHKYAIMIPLVIPAVHGQYRIMLRPFASLVLCLLLAAPLFPASADDPNASVREALQAELEDFSSPEWPSRPVPPRGPALSRYHDRLLEVAGNSEWRPRVRTGTIPLIRTGHPAEKLGINVFFPEGKTQGTLLFVHGYMSHAANFAYTFEQFSRQGWNVITLDLPGHGLSTGPRADIDSFTGYGDAVQTWFDWVNSGAWEGPRVLLAHSLGSAAALEALRRPGTVKPDKVIFCAPLLRPDWYPALVFGEKTLGWWLKKMPSRFGWDGYLDGYAMPVHWFTALDQWLERLKFQGALDLPLTIFSGDKDDVVDEGWNRNEYKRIVPGARYQVLPGKGHLFLTETADRKAAQDLLAAELALTPLPRRE